MFRKTFSVFALLLSVSVIAFFSCKKENSAIVDTKWNVDDTHFQANNQGGVLLQTDTGTLFAARTVNGDVAAIVFKSSISTGAYKIANSTKKKLEDLAGDECILTISKGKERLYLPAFDDAGIVNITQSGKKHTATFDNVKLGYFDLEIGNVIEVTASGKIIEK